MKKWQLWCGISLVFLAGVGVGAAGTGLYVRHAVQSIVEEGPPAMTRLVMKKLTRELELSGPQQAEVVQIVRETQAQLQELRRRNRPETSRIIAAGMARMKADLSPAQGAKLDALYEKLTARWSVRDNTTGR